MILHVLSGDSLLPPFLEAGIPGDVAVFRECLCDGPVKAVSLYELFRTRDEYLSGEDTSKAGFYSEHVKPEIEKIFDSPEETEICLWFEHELFCQVNLWFLLSELKKRRRLSFVGPPSEPYEQRFDGWSALDGEDLATCFNSREEIDGSDVRLASELWSAFRDRDRDRLRELSNEPPGIFCFLPEVAKAAADIDERPESVIRELIEKGADGFGECFRAFRENYPVYGFGDLQVRSIWEKVAKQLS